MVDTGSSVTILSWNVFQAISSKAQVPARAPYKPEVTLCDYSQRPILLVLWVWCAQLLEWNHVRDDRSNSTAIVQLVHSQNVPSQKGTLLEAQVETSPSTPLLFEPEWLRWEWKLRTLWFTLMLKVELGYMLATTLMGQLSLSRMFPLGVWWHVRDVFSVKSLR